MLKNTEKSSMGQFGPSIEKDGYMGRLDDDYLNFVMERMRRYLATASCTPIDVIASHPEDYRTVVQHCHLILEMIMDVIENEEQETTNNAIYKYRYEEVN